MRRVLTAAVLCLVFVSATFGVPTSARTQPEHMAANAVTLHYLFGSGSTTGGRSITVRAELTGPAPARG
ncbi:MAG TPA: hypothetical protein PK819_10410, partial [Thermomicrobiales bacterium]|nr:hypothetical protein [Thermomicrobiales bacterium]